MLCLLLLPPVLQIYNTYRTPCVLQLPKGTVADRASHEVILEFMSMIDVTEMEADFEKLPLYSNRKKANCLDSSPQRVAPFASQYDPFTSAYCAAMQ